MNAPFSRKFIRASIITLGLAIAIAGPARAELADLTDVPLATAPSDAVLPNLMYVIDDSGSMMWDYMPDNVHELANGTDLQNCKTCDSGSCTIAATQCRGSSDGDTADWGEPPYFTAQFNQIYYNPDVSYPAGVDAAGATLGDISATAAPKDFYLDATTTNLTTTYPEIYYCNTSSPSAANLTDTAVCRRNGINNVSLGYFLYWKNSSTDGGFPNATGTSSSTFRHRIERYTGHPYYFTIAPHEHCSDTNLINCTLSATPTVSFTIPAPIRYCSSTGNASSTAVMSDAATSTTPKCRKKFDASSYPYPRYGRFTRRDIVPATASYPQGPNAIRPDCATANCTYAEELQNVANWYSYYRTRMAMMKTATGRAFVPINDRYRVGFITINPGSPVRSTANVASDFRYLPLATYDSTQKGDFYDILYDQTNHGTTPLRQALARVGRHYANVTTGINSGMPQDPITHSCQQNFALLTSDGYWNDNDSDARDTSATGTVGNQDNVPNSTDPFYVSRPTVTLDGVGTETEDVTPLTIREQVVCTGDASVLGGSNNCDCAAGSNFKRVKQRTRNQQLTVDKTDGIQTSSNTTTVGGDTFQDITACKATLVTTITTNVTLTETRDCQGNGSTGTFTYGGSQTCNCNAGREVLFRQTRTGATRTRITVDGLPASDTVTGGVTTYTDSVANGGPFTALPAATGGTCFNGTTLNDVAAAFSGGTTTVLTTGSTTTAADITITPNPLTTSGTTTTTTTAWGGSSNTLADVAMYYYKNDLRTGAPTSKSDNTTVKTSDKDIAKHQHMVTFTLGLGLQGQMDYVADYTGDPTGDYSKIKAADTTCAWTTGTCNWPTPSSGAPTTLDDLWHAAINGRGIYYSASDPNTLADGLSGALAALEIETAAASASATSSPNITETDNFIYSSTFQTVKWDGEITAQRIDTISGEVLPGIAWKAQELLDTKVGTAEALTPPGDGRNIWTLDPSGTNNLKSFEWANLTAAEQAYFANKCTALSQCPLLTLTQQGQANDGNNMVNFLRGRSTHEATVFRDRDHVLGDPVNATPAYVKAPRFNFSDLVTPTYQDFQAAQTSRQGVLYIAANDGMLHAFNGDTGQELWAYVPRIVFPDLHALATKNWDVRHQYSVDGSPQVMDIYDSGAWKTVLVAGLGKGGRGFYALDVTNPSSPKGLWEVCSDPTLCAVSDDDIGYSFGYPVVTKRATDGRWIALVTSGMNNVGPGTGRGFLYVLDALTGALLRKVDTGAGDAATPSGLSKISAFADSFNTNNTATFVYGGDLLGNLWRFDMSANPPTVLKMAELKDGSGNPQSVTTRPELALVDGYRVVYVGTGRYLGADDLPDPATLSPALPWAYQQSFYAIKDRNVVHGNIRTAAPGLQQQTITALTADSRSTSTNVVDWATKDGWYVDFNPGNTSPGERVNLDPLLALGTLVVTTNVPNNNACATGGDGWIYQFDYKDGTYVANAPGNQVAQKFTGETLVGVVVVRLPSGVLKAIATGATGDKETVGVNVGGGGGAGRRVSWRELIE